MKIYEKLRFPLFLIIIFLFSCLSVISTENTDTWQVQSDGYLYLPANYTATKGYADKNLYSEKDSKITLSDKAEIFYHEKGDKTKKISKDINQVKDGIKFTAIEPDKLYIIDVDSKKYPELNGTATITVKTTYDKEPRLYKYLGQESVGDKIFDKYMPYNAPLTYDEKTKEVTFTVNSFSIYAIGGHEDCDTRNPIYTPPISFISAIGVTDKQAILSYYFGTYNNPYEAYVRNIFRYRETLAESWTGTVPLENTGTYSPYDPVQNLYMYRTVTGLDYSTFYEYYLETVWWEDYGYSYCKYLMNSDTYYFNTESPSWYLPDVQTSEATDLYLNTARLHGSVDPRDADSVYVYFEWRPYPSSDVWDYSTSGLTVTDPGYTNFYATISDYYGASLVDGNTYQFRVCGDYDDEYSVAQTVCSEVELFNASSGEPEAQDPELEVSYPLLIGDTYATLPAELTDMGSYEKVYVTFWVWEADDFPGTFQYSTTQEVTSVQELSWAVSDLTPNTLYRFDVDYAWYEEDCVADEGCADGWALSDDYIEFYTTGDFTHPTVITQNPSSINSSQATARASINIQDADNVTAYFEYRPYSASVFDTGTRSSNTTITDSGNVSFSAFLTDLNASTVYQYRACIEYLDDSDDEWITCASVLSFNTSDSIDAGESSLSSGLLAYYSFDAGSTLIDSIGVFNLTSSSYYTALGVINESINFTDGKYAYFNATGFPSGTSDITYTFWAKTPTGTWSTSQYDWLISSGNSASPNDYILSVLNYGATSLVLFIGDGGTTSNTGAINTANGDGAWHHYVITRMSGNRLILIEDNVVLYNNTITSKTNAVNDAFVINGNLALGNSLNNQINIDEFSVYDRSLTKDEIYYLFTEDEQYPYGSVSVETKVFPTMYVYPVIGQNSSSATIRGSITDFNDYSYAYTYFFIKNDSDENYTESTDWVNQSSTGVYSHTISTLEENSTYDFMFCVQVNEFVFTEYRCLESTFSTDPYVFSVPGIQTTDAYDVDHESAILGGYVYSMGFAGYVDTYFLWREYDVGALWNESEAYERLSATGGFAEVISGLDPSTTYQFVACADYKDNNNITNTACGTVKTFTTLSILFSGIDFDVGEPSYITHNQADFTGAITDMNGVAEIYYYFRYKPISESTYTYTNEESATGEMSVTYDMSAGGLEPETDYEVDLCIEDITIGTVRCSDPYYFNTLEYSVYIAPTLTDSGWDEVWSSIFGESYMARWIAGLFIVFAVIFMGISAFGQFGMQMSGFAVMIFTFLGFLSATLLQLFPIYVMILALVGIVLILILKTIAFPDSSGG